MSLSTWTTEQLLSLASDNAMINAAQSAADPLKWSSLGRSPQGIWGEFTNRGKPPQQTFLAMPNLAPSCDCFSRKFPCRHTIGLALLFKESPNYFDSFDQPAWLPVTKKNEEKFQEPSQQRERYETQLSKTKSILEAYALWLHDLIHSGLAALPKQPPSYWSSMAQRLRENGLTTLSEELRLLPVDAKMPKTSAPALMSNLGQSSRSPIKKKEKTQPTNWPLVILQQLGRHYLITQGFANYDRLSPPAQADLRYAVGWFSNPDEQPAETMRDHWLVIGGRFHGQHKDITQESWLWGRLTKRFILISRPFPRNDPAFNPLISGATAAATIDILPGAWPFRGQIRELHAISQQQAKVPALNSLKKAQAAFGRALSSNPWINVIPLAFDDMNVQRLDDHWYLRDRQGYGFPLPADFPFGWHLAAMQQEADTQIFGEWDGRFFTPLSFIENSQTLPIHILNGVK